jgi:hypothetical protein
MSLQNKGYIWVYGMKFLETTMTLEKKLEMRTQSFFSAKKRLILVKAECKQGAKVIYIRVPKSLEIDKGNFNGQIQMLNGA